MQVEKEGKLMDGPYVITTCDMCLPSGLPDECPKSFRGIRIGSAKEAINAGHWQTREFGLICPECILEEAHDLAEFPPEEERHGAMPLGVMFKPLEKSNDS
jgi:hypothetical protein